MLMRPGAELRIIEACVTNVGLPVRPTGHRLTVRYVASVDAGTRWQSQRQSW